ncbi:MAG: cell surface protein SprA [Reichenbachiella sp.]
MTLDLEIDTGMNYTIYERIGALNYRPRTTMTFDQFIKFQEERAHKEYFQNRSAGLDGESAVSARRLIPKIYISPVFDRIFGGNYVDIQPTGFVNLDFGGSWQTVENPAVPVNQQRNGGFDYDQQISMNVIGKVGEKLAITANFDNENSFDYENNLKIEFTGYEEDIIKKIEIGNVSMPVANSLMSGGQALFGVKTQLQFGKLFVTGLASRQQGSTTTQTFNQNSDNIQDLTGIKVSEYDEYKHFFLGHFFRDHYEEWLVGLPQVRSSLMIQNIQVYVVKNQNNNQTTGLRSIVALSDLGEFETRNIGNPIVMPIGSDDQTDNDANDLFDRIVNDPAIRNVETAPTVLTGLGLSDNVDFAIRNTVRKLDATEYNVKQDLGYITLRSPLNEGEVLAVSFEYSHNGRRFQVGELSNSNPNSPSDEALILKLLKPTRQNLDKPIWDLAMKNIYTLSGARNMTEADFKMQIVYDDNTTNYRAPNLNEGTNTNNVPLIQVLKLDQLNRNQDPQPDANFDFIEGVTFDVEYGAVIFPVLEPFGSTLEAAFTDSEQTLKDKYVFHELYDQTKVNARQNSLKNKFELLPEYQGRAQREYILDGFSVLEGSVVVTSGSQVLIEGTQYQVSYLGGAKVTIIDDGILNSGNPITISYEQADVFSFSSKWLTGARLDYQFNDKINLGATVMHLSERTGGVSRYTIGNEPVKNTKYGFDVNFQEDSRILTKIIDALPLISTKETSTITFNGEFAQLISGTSNEVNGESTGYIDDFESAATTYSLAGGHLGWKIGATPTQNPNENFDRRVPNTPDSALGLGYKRAKMAWYTIDRSFYIPGGNRPSNITDEDLANAYVKRVLPQDIFQVDPLVVNTNLSTFDVAYFPHERGFYNYNNNPDEFQSNGLFNNPQENFGAITRQVPVNFDFTRNNIEYIEFWLMDPFITEDNGGAVMDGIFNRPNTTGGELVFNLGEVSEDVLEDNVHSFENGLPPDGGDAGSRITEWGRMPTQDYLTQYFDATGSARSNQDVGLDGLDSEVREKEFFQEHMKPILDRYQPGDPVRIDLESDFSNDDYKFYLDSDYDVQQILERYKDYNGLEDNSNTDGGGSFSSQGTNLPDNEDLNEDNFVSQEESYFEYRIPLNRNEIENNRYVVEKKLDIAQQATWYLFRIPIQEPTRSFNEPDFNFLRYMRMYMTGWSQPVVLRMANFQMVSSQWRKFTNDLTEEGFGTVPEPAESDFELSVVSVEQNSSPAGGKPPYVLPPGIERDLDNTTSVTRRVNEQSLKLCVSDLKDGDARAAFKTPVTVDLVNYGRMKMFFHAETVGSEMLLDDDLNGFLRLARDETENYYEIEVPLKVTQDNVTGTSDQIRRQVWPEENEINLALSELYTLKSARNAEQEDVTLSYSRPSSDGKYILTIKGNPKLSDVQYLMIGVRNPKDEGRNSHSGCIWANELRVTDFDNQNGWAANARMNIKLADFATLNASTRYTSVGFGSIQDGISDRTREEKMQYDLSANVNVDKLIPWKTGIKIPMFVSLSNSVETPKYDPLDSDIPLEATLDRFNSSAEREEYKNKVISQKTSKSINFMDVSKDKVKQDAKQHIYDVENLSFSYSYSEDRSSNQNMAESLRKKYFGSVSYIYSPKPPSLEPFKNSKAFSSPYLKLIKDINFSPFPNNISVRASIDRSFNRSQLRNADLTTEGIDPTYEKLFYFDRTYNVRWNIFKSVGLNYTATVHAIIDEAEGEIDTYEEREEIWENIKSMGRTKTFKQTVSANYRVPLDKLPFTDWLSADYRYSVDYNWRGTNVSQEASFGNTVDNARTQDLNGKIDLLKLYNKSKGLKDINSPGRNRPKARGDTTATKTTSSVLKGLMRLLMSVRSITGTYSVRESTELPGILGHPYLFGMDDNWESPGWDFVFGSQNPDKRFEAAQRDWLAADSLDQTSPFLQRLTEEINVKTTIEPFKDFRIQVDMRRTNTSDYQEIFRKTEGGNPLNNGFESLTPTRSGAYTITFLPISTSFLKDEEFNSSSSFEEFISNRAIIQRRQNDENTEGNYGENSQDVLIPSFIAAYTGENAENVSLSPFPTFPMPNWRLDYAGLAKFDFLKNMFTSINITHAYTSTFSITNYINSSYYSDPNMLDLSNNILDYPKASIVPENEDFLTPVYTINQVAISERFSPLVGVNMRTKNNISMRVEYSRERNLLMDLTNSQITELQSSDVTFDFGISKNEWKLPFKIKGRTSIIKNNLQFRMAFTVRDTRTLQRKIEVSEETGDDIQLSTLTDGSINYRISPTLSYAANQKLNLTMYYEKTINEPQLSSSFNRSATAFGIQVRFSLSQ